MTFAEIYADVQAYFASRNDVTAAIAKAAVNDVYKRLSMSFRFYELEFDTTQATVDGTASYTIPTGARKTIGIVDTTNHWQLDPRDIRWYMGQWTGTGYTGRPEYYVRYGSKYYVWPTPDDAYSLQIYYNKLPTELSADADEPVFPEEWHKVLSLISAADVGFQLGLDTRAMNLKNEGLGIITMLQEDRVMDERQKTIQVQVAKTRPTGRQRGSYAEYP